MAVDVTATWRDEIATAVQPALEPTASVWDRSRALRTLEQVLLPRFRQERVQLELAGAAIDRRTKDRLWTAGELLELLVGSLEQDVRLPFRGERFAAGLGALLRALDHWCEEAELAARLARRH